MAPGPSRGRPAATLPPTRAVLTRSVVAIPDVLEDPEYAIGATRRAPRAFAASLAVPLMRDGKPIGVIGVGRPEPGPFPDKQIALLQTFADQAVIAIENVRLFKELEARTARADALGRRAAGAGRGRAGGQLDARPRDRAHHDRLARHAARRAWTAASIYEYDEAREEFYLRATDRLPDELVERAAGHADPEGRGALGRLAVTRRAGRRSATSSDERSYQSRVREIARSAAATGRCSPCRCCARTICSAAWP